MCPVRKDIHANELGKVSMRNEYGKERNIEKIKIKYRKNEKNMQMQTENITRIKKNENMNTEKIIMQMNNEKKIYIHLQSNHGTLSIQTSSNGTANNKIK